MIQVMGVFHPDGSRPDVQPAGALPTSVEQDLGPLERQLSEALKVVNSKPDSFVWVALFDPTSAELALVRDAFDLSQLQLDDAANPRHRAKLELAKTNAFIIFKLIDYVDATSDVENYQMSIFVGAGYVITVRLGATGGMDWVPEQLDGANRLLRYGPVAILHAILDDAVDGYLRVADELSNDIEEIEESVFSPNRTDNSTRIYYLKRETLEIRRAVAALVPVAADLVSNRSILIPKPLRPHFRDIADHILRVNDICEANDSLLMTMLMASTARQDLQQNKDMRRISAWVAMAAIPTMIAGIYGMNFDNMPELHQPWAYPAVLLAMATICGFMYRAFRRSGWL